MYNILDGRNEHLRATLHQHGGFWKSKACEMSKVAYRMFDAKADTLYD